MVLNRWRAAPIHLALSAAVAAIVFAVIYFAWYPGALYDDAGGRELFLLIAGVDVTMGPLITLIVFVPGKKGLKFDLAVIAVAQIVALSYGTWVLYESRPAWIVFVKDRFELVRANQIQQRGIAKAQPAFVHPPITGPRVVAARLPKNPDEQFHLAISAVAGADVQTYPRYLVPYDGVRSDVIAHAKPLAQLRKLNPGAIGAIDALPAKLHLPEERLGFVPMRAGKRDLTVIVDRSNGDYLGNFALRPWQY